MKQIQLRKNKKNCYCRFCKTEGKEKVKCVWRAKYNAVDHNKHYSCGDHKHLIEDTDPLGVHEEAAKQCREIRDSGSEYYTEADYATWLRL